MITIGINWEIDEENNLALVHMMEKSINEIPEDRREDVKNSIKKQLKEFGWDGEIKYK